tara:strand:- start:1624 stop:1875 length:252 start_codon:yes stop_codon:yes gene_type:complete
MQAQQQSPTTGHVYETQCEGIFGVVSFFPETVVSLAVLTNGESVAQACKVLASRFAGKFVQADADATAWGKVSFRAQGSAIMM